MPTNIQIIQETFKYFDRKCCKISNRLSFLFIRKQKNLHLSGDFKLLTVSYLILSIERTNFSSAITPLRASQMKMSQTKGNAAVHCGWKVYPSRP